MLTPEPKRDWLISQNSLRGQDDVAVMATLDLAEGLQGEGCFLLVHARTGVLDADRKGLIRLVPSRYYDGTAWIYELDGVRQQVEHELAHAVRVDVEVGEVVGQVRIDGQARTGNAILDKT